jgi:hypothetical protein
MASTISSASLPASRLLPECVALTVPQSLAGRFWGVHGPIRGSSSTPGANAGSRSSQADAIGQPEARKVIAKTEPAVHGGKASDGYEDRGAGNRPMGAGQITECHLRGFA